MLKRKAEVPKIKHVQQKHKSGCLIACIAMVLGCEYDDVVKEFQNDFDKRGTKTEWARNFICERRHSVIEKRGTHYGHIEEHNKRMMIPFAPIHIVTVQQFIDQPKLCHSFVMDSAGTIYDPDDKDAKEVFYYEAIHVMGFWKD